METEIFKWFLSHGESSMVMLLFLAVAVMYKRIVNLNDQVDKMRKEFSEAAIKMNKDYCNALNQFSAALNDLKAEFSKRYELVEQFSSTLKSIQKIIEGSKHYD